ncbi:hypothetical protein MOC30_01705, partial [Bacillus spizizenii]|nr:hypothetical protein [Bacillus spizizenii]
MEKRKNDTIDRYDYLYLSKNTSSLIIKFRIIYLEYEKMLNEKYLFFAYKNIKNTIFPEKYSYDS